MLDCSSGNQRAYIGWMQRLLKTLVVQVGMPSPAHLSTARTEFK